jgi:hypothetical protein
MNPRNRFRVMTRNLTEWVTVWLRTLAAEVLAATTGFSTR